MIFVVLFTGHVTGARVNPEIDTPPPSPPSSLFANPGSLPPPFSQTPKSKPRNEPFNRPQTPISPVISGF